MVNETDYMKSLTLNLLLDLILDCTNGNVRLIGGAASNEGTVEVCTNKLWGLISDVGWDENDAKVICRQLNLPYNGQ